MSKYVNNNREILPKFEETAERGYLDKHYELLSKLSGEWPATKEIAIIVNMMPEDLRNAISEASRAYKKLSLYYQKQINYWESINKNNEPIRPSTKTTR